MCSRYRPSPSTFKVREEARKMTTKSTDAKPGHQPPKKGSAQALEKRDEKGLSAKDERIISDTVAFINKKMDTASTSLIEIGQYLLKHFFDGDIKKVQDRAPRKGASLRKLAEHPDINMSAMGLSNAVNLAVQEEFLGSVKTSLHLTPSHKLLLLRVEDIKDKKKYIAEIEKDELSIRAFRDRLMKDGVIKERGLAAVEDEEQRKLLRSGVQRVLRPFESILEIDLEHLLDMPSERLSTAVESMKKAREKLDAMIERVQERLAR
jgi:hypothetical protein